MVSKGFVGFQPPKTSHRFYILAPAQPVASRPRRSTKDAFYDKLSTLTATKKMDINEEFYEYSPKPKAKKVPKRTGSSSSSADGPSSSKFMRPMLIHPNHESTLLPIRLSPPVRINGLHHYLTELRKPHLQLGELNIESIPIDPRMRFRCDLCFRRFPLQIDLELHLGTHVEDISACSLCDKPSKPFSMEEYTKHVSSHFIKVRSFDILVHNVMEEYIFTYFRNLIRQLVFSVVKLQLQKVPLNLLNICFTFVQM